VTSPDRNASIRITFFQECEEQLAALESGLLDIQGGNSEPEVINSVFRAVHSIKGGAGAFDLEDLVRFAHIFETALDNLRSGRVAADAPVVEVLLRAADMLTDLVAAARGGTPADLRRSGALAEELAGLGGDPVDTAAPSDDDAEISFTVLRLDLPDASAAVPAPTAPAMRRYVIRFRPHAALYAKANEAGLILRELRRLGTAEIQLDPSALPPFEDLDPEGAYLAWTIRLASEQNAAGVRAVFDFVDSDCDLDISSDAAEQGREREAISIAPIAAPGGLDGAAAAPVEGVAAARPVTPVVAAAAAAPRVNNAAAAPAAATIRVDLERVDRLINLVGELVISQAMLAQRVAESSLGRASGVAIGLGELEQLTRDIQESVMAIRAQPIKVVFQRMSRLVREVASLTGKKVRLITEGENTEIDKSVIEQLSDPLTHMIRNAIDHGLEKPADRLAAGKSEEGTVRLSASHHSGRIVIEVADDGAGINRPRVKEIAAKKGLIAADAALRDDEIDNLIFMAGFSTAEAVSDVSGRGVGMDVVQRSIQALRGRISIASRPGAGSTFTLSLPLTLAVLDGMVISVADQMLVVPLTAMIETLKPKAGEIRALGPSASVIEIRGVYVPVIDAGLALGYRCEPLSSAAGVVLFVECAGGRRAALLVDAILDQRQVVIKSLEANYQKIPGIAAATILGDGRVALILDVDAIAAKHFEPPRTERQLAKAG
jgi:two-component system, chemotaxis family, sensor kinase CheA